MTATMTRTWQVADVLGPVSPGAITRTTLALFAGGSGDHNEIHLDIAAAQAAGMPDVFGHGMLSMAYLGRLLTDTFGQAAILSFTSRFVSITPVGAMPTCSGSVVKITDGIAHVELSARLEDGTVTITGTASIDLAKARTPEGSQV